MCLLGLTIVIGGHHTTWNRALAAGWWPSSLALVIIAGAYVVFIFSLAELTGTWPLAGGSHVLGRLTLGYFFGFMLGAVDVLVGVTRTAHSILTIADVLEPRVKTQRLLLWIGVIALSVALLSRADRTVWRVTRFLGVVTVPSVMVFIFGSLRHCHLITSAIRSMNMVTLEQQSDSLEDIVRSDERLVVAGTLTASLVILALYYFLYASVAQGPSTIERGLLQALSGLRGRQAHANTLRITAVKPTTTVSVNKEGSLTMADLVQLGIKEGTFREETDPSEETEGQCFPNPLLPQAVGSSSPGRTIGQHSIRWSSGSFQRVARLERLKEETDQELRAAMSGIWSQRSRRSSGDNVHRSMTAVVPSGSAS
ncbi:hypothetical protein ATCC90586_001563 [Pythium insidiosum]|nr:hypothetical protein ATCC90586_001563 [Pythium insidiosum]